MIGPHIGCCGAGGVDNHQIAWQIIWSRNRNYFETQLEWLHVKMGDQGNVVIDLQKVSTRKGECFEGQPCPLWLDEKIKGSSCGWIFNTENMDETQNTLL